jgi:hypothetical protein
MQARFTADYYMDAVGRRRKLSAGAMAAIQREFANGRSTADLAGAYGVSAALIRNVCYLTPRQSDLEKIKLGRVHVEGTES